MVEWPGKRKALLICYDRYAQYPLGVTVKCIRSISTSLCGSIESQAITINFDF